MFVTQFVQLEHLIKESYDSNCEYETRDGIHSYALLTQRCWAVLLGVSDS